MITKHIVETTREYDAQGNLVSENIIETNETDGSIQAENSEGNREWVEDAVNKILTEALSRTEERRRRWLKKRQAEGIAAAKERGQRFGKPPLEVPSNWQEVYDRWRVREITAKRAMELTGLKKTSFYKLVKRAEGRENG